MRGIALSLLFALTAVAHAGTDTEEPPGTPGATPAAPADTKSEDTAFWLSAGGAGGSVALVGVGLAVSVIFPGGDSNETRLLKVPLHNWGNGIATAGLLASGLAPSFGEWYSGHFWTGGLGLRMAGAAVMGIGAATNHCIDPADFDCNPDHSGSTTLIAIGAVTYGAGVIYDVATARRSARDYNREHAHVAVSPAPVSHGYGLVLAGSF